MPNSDKDISSLADLASTLNKSFGTLHSAVDGLTRSLTGGTKAGKDLTKFFGDMGKTGKTLLSQLSSLTGSNGSLGKFSKAVGKAASAASEGGGGGIADIISVLGAADLALDLDPLTAVIGVVVTGLTALAIVAEMSASKINSYTGAQASLGNNAKSFNDLTSVTTPLGMTPTQAASMAREFQQALETGPGIAFATQIGVNPMGGPFGDNDYAAKLYTAIKELSSNKYSDQQAFRIADAYGSQFSQAVMTRRMASPEALARVDAMHANITPTEAREAVDNQLLMNASLEQTSVLMAKLGALILPTVNSVLGSVADGLIGVSRYWGVLVASLRAIQDVITGAWFNIPEDLKAAQDALAQANSAHPDAQKAATDRNTAATDRLTTSLDKMRNQLGYGASRAHTAVPKGWFNYGNSADGAKGRAMASGAVLI